jgi:EAL domain-containing protein (putative c-di-GMP-specific phosphodiesterase class I)
MHCHPIHPLPAKSGDKRRVDIHDAVGERLNELRRIGVHLSLDDFGTGFAWRAYLNDFPFSKIKIDRKFVQDIDASSRTFAIIKGISQIARELRIERVAEGVETLAQLQRMQSFGINAIQGYLFSRPMAAAPLRELVKAPISPAVEEFSDSGAIARPSKIAS